MVIERDETVANTALIYSRLSGTPQFFVYRRAPFVAVDGIVVTFQSFYAFLTSVMVGQTSALSRSTEPGNGHPARLPCAADVHAACGVPCPPDPDAIWEGVMRRELNISSDFTKLRRNRLLEIVRAVYADWSGAIDEGRLPAEA